MRILLDTHILIWALAQPDKLSKDVRAAIQAQENDVLFSAASIWEIAIKLQIGRIVFAVQPDEIAREAVNSGFEELPVSANAAAHVARLPLHHRDPFDRILVAQAIVEPARLFTVDAILARYSELVTLV